MTTVPHSADTLTPILRWAGRGIGALMAAFYLVGMGQSKREDTHQAGQRCRPA
jgi:hypothetical protein